MSDITSSQQSSLKILILIFEIQGIHLVYYFFAIFIYYQLKKVKMQEEDLNLIRRYFGKIRRPEYGDKIYKEECVLSFDNAESKFGLFVSLATHLAYGADFVEHDFNQTGNGLYLHIKTTKTLKEVKEEEDGKPKPTKLAIGVEGGFKLEHEQYDYSNEYSLYVLPEKKFFTFPNADLPTLVSDVMNALINLQDADKQENIQSACILFYYYVYCISI